VVELPIKIKGLEGPSLQPKRCTVGAILNDSVYSLLYSYFSNIHFNNILNLLHFFFFFNFRARIVPAEGYVSGQKASKYVRKPSPNSIPSIVSCVMNYVLLTGIEEVPLAVGDG
jgi:hypothetical protein